ncbi:MAG: hypothetical protein Q9162_005767 [Coniocarpon cinnabarinum]
MSLSGLPAVTTRPMSVSQIVKAASEQFFDPWYPPKNWFRTAEHMLKQGNVYLREKNLQAAYFILYRHVMLISNELPKHPQANNPDYKRSWVEATRDAEKSLQILEDIKGKINRNYEKYLLKRQEAKEKARKEKREEQVALQEMESERESAELLDPAQHSHIGVSLANSRTGQRTRRYEHSQDTDNPDGEEDLEAMMKRTRRQLDRDSAISDRSQTSSQAPRYTSYRYPSILHSDSHASSSTTYDRTPRTSSLQLNTTPGSSLSAPPILPKRIDDFVLPARPPKLPSAAPLLPAKAPEPIPSSRTSTPAPAAEQFRTTSELESGVPLRTLFLPADLRHTFLGLAQANTNRNLESLGLLCGHLIRNAFFITALLLPPQTSTSDTCEMTPEGEVAVDEYISAHGQPDPEPSNSDDEGDTRSPKPVNGEATNNGDDMIVLGWIHTHPSQTCFLSSRDLHTHVWYQNSLPESIALVCSPSKSPGLGSSWNAFRLTDPPGMGVVRSCKKAGVFHLHEGIHEGGIYTDVVNDADARNAGHVREVKSLHFDVVDLRDT